ncbi:FecR domain-containing protein [Sphingosinicella sp.]|uniref:FecR family protein n=1 Tax=Sphingosinicella sp. TaxID=1917971 RepID=UPI002624074C|nr:FecR domain-containing protein [Sphingosinicella sp.]
MTPRSVDGDARVAEASDWYARMRGPEAADDRAAFEAWCADPENARVYREIEEVWNTAGRSSLRKQPAGKQTSARWKPLAAVAAIVLLLLGVSLLSAGSPVLPEQAPAKVLALASGDHERRAWGLADGSSVLLDGGGALAVEYSGAERRIRLDRGRARFVVAHDAARPFVVFAAGTRVVAWGTVFDVAAGDTGAEVTLLEGVVDVSAANASKPATLNPGERIVTRDGSAGITAAPAVTARWTEGLVLTHRLPLAQLVAEANRSPGARIELADPALGALRVSGTMRLGDPRLADKLAATLDLAVVREPGGIIRLQARSF